MAEIGPDVSAGLPAWIYGHLDAIQGQAAQDHASPPQEPPQEFREVEGELQTWLDRADAHAPLQPLTEDFYLPGDFQALEGDQELTLPYNWEPRHYQRALWNFLIEGGKRASVVAHRRWGKDEVCLHWAACAMHMQVGNYWHMLPKAKQARKAIWTAINPHTGRRRIEEAFPDEIVKRRLDDEMFIETNNGSTWQVLGSDNFDALVGSPPLGITFSEWALANPLAWAILRPILRENKGWALFIGTPRGHNHAEKTHKIAQQSDSWHCELQTVNETDVFTAEDIEMEREELIGQYGKDLGEALLQQEYYCSFSAAIPGAYFAAEMADLRKQGRIGTHVKHNKALLVHTLWDIGFDDPTAIVFVQFDGPYIMVIDFYQSNGAGIAEYARVLDEKARELGYRYGAHVGPHDLKQHEVGSGLTVKKQARDAGIRFDVTPRMAKLDSIQCVRTWLPRCYFSEDGECATLVAALEQHHAEYNEETQTFNSKPEHDWTSHPVDAFKTGASAPVYYFTRHDLSRQAAESAYRATDDMHSANENLGSWSM